MDGSCHKNCKDICHRSTSLASLASAVHSSSTAEMDGVRRGVIGGSVGNMTQALFFLLFTIGWSHPPSRDFKKGWGRGHGRAGLIDLDTSESPLLLFILGNFLAHLLIPVLWSPETDKGMLEVWGQARDISERRTQKGWISKDELSISESVKGERSMGRNTEG